jgi:hypothetical protein
VQSFPLGSPELEEFDRWWREIEQRCSPAAGRWTPVATENLGTLRHRRVRVIRGYGMMDRNEAPQFYPEVKGARGVAAE